ERRKDADVRRPGEDRAPLPRSARGIVCEQRTRSLSIQTGTISMSDSIDRRTFLTGVAALAATGVVGCKSPSKQEHTITVGPTTEETAGLGAEDSSSATMSYGRPALRLLTVEADGSPLSSERMRTRHARDLHNSP